MTMTFHCPYCGLKSLVFIGTKGDANLYRCYECEWRWAIERLRKDS
jgi:DNA-directed RNA polymerase subunit RPC12/RpoP